VLYTLLTSRNTFRTLTLTADLHQAPPAAAGRAQVSEGPNPSTPTHLLLHHPHTAHHSPLCPPPHPPPTPSKTSNHLDIDAVDALIEGLAMFKGGVLVVSLWY
jgi:hypothetical protein